MYFILLCIQFTEYIYFFARDKREVETQIVGLRVLIAHFRDFQITQHYTRIYLCVSVYQFHWSHRP